MKNSIKSQLICFLFVGIGLIITSCGKDNLTQNTFDEIWSKQINVECNSSYVPPLGSPSNHSVKIETKFGNLAYIKKRKAGGPIVDNQLITKDGRQIPLDYQISSVNKDRITGEHYLIYNNAISILEGGIGSNIKFSRSLENLTEFERVGGIIIGGGQLFYLVDTDDGYALASQFVEENSIEKKIPIENSIGKSISILHSQKVENDLIITINIKDTNTENFPSEILAYSVNQEKVLWRIDAGGNVNQAFSSGVYLIVEPFDNDGIVLDILTGEELMTLGSEKTLYGKTAFDGSRFFYSYKPNNDNGEKERVKGLDLETEEYFFDQEIYLLTVENEQVYGIDRDKNLFVYNYDEKQIAKVDLTDIENREDYYGWQVTHDGSRLFAQKQNGCSTVSLILLEFGIQK